MTEADKLIDELEWAVLARSNDMPGSKERLSVAKAAIRGRLSADESTRAPDGWRPIETAPKGRTVLVGYTNRAGKWRTVRAHYYPPQTLELGDYWQGGDDEGDGFAPEGWYEEVENSETINFTEEPPTHWMPLPAPPSGERPSAPAPEGTAVLTRIEREAEQSELSNLRQLAKEYDDLIHHMNGGGDFHEFMRNKFREQYPEG